MKRASRAASMSTSKRSRLETVSTSGSGQEPLLLVLPGDVLENVLSRLTAPSLVAVNGTCKALRAWDPKHRLRLVEKVARDAVVALCGAEGAERWR